MIIFFFFSSIIVYGQTNEEVLTNTTLTNLFQKGLSSSIIVSKIKTSKTNFDVSIDALIKLKYEKIPDEITNAMVEASGNKDQAVVDVNDPKANHDPGLYYFSKKNDKAEMVSLEPTVCAQAKMGSGIVTQLTYGIAKTKMKSSVSGLRARFQIDDSNPVFYFYFDKVQNLNNAPTWFSQSSSPNEFILVKMSIGRSDREFVTGSMNAYSGTSMGVDENQKIGFNIEKIKSGVYKVTPQAPLIPGEYCFMSAGSSTMGATVGKIFDFGVKGVINGKLNDNSEITPMAYNKGEISLNAGIGFVNFLTSDQTETPPLSVTVDYGLSDEVSLGFYLGYASSSVSNYNYRSTNYYPYYYSYNSTSTTSYLIIGARGIYHFGTTGKFDPYGGAMLGYNNISGDYGSISGFIFTPFLGTHYYFSKKFGVFGELGYGVALITLGATIKI